MKNATDPDKLKARFQEVQRQRLLVGNEIRSMREKEDQILKWVPRLRKVAEGKYVVGAEPISDFGPEIEDTPKWHLPDECLDKNEALAQAEIGKLHGQIFEKHQRLKELREGEAEIGVQLAIRGIPVSNDGRQELNLPLQEKKLNVGNTAQEKPVEFTHSEDFRSITFKGEPSLLTTRQAQVIQILFEAHREGHPDVHQDRILEKLGTGKSRLRDTFRTPNRELWKTLIVSQKRGFFRLDL